MSATRLKFIFIVLRVYAVLPYTLIKQRFFYRLRKPPEGLPEFICIGAQKCGTTWLNDQLRAHPDVCTSSPKEARYFDWYFYHSFRWYLRHFKSDKPVCGEVTPGYSVIEKGRIRFMRRTMPGLKIIFLMRDPRQRAWSSARFHLGKQLGKDINTLSDDQFINHLDKGWVKRMGDYEEIWKKWTAVYPRENFLVLFTEEIEREPAAVLEKVCRFIGVKFAADEKLLQAHPNASPELKMPVRVKEFLDERYRKMIAEMPQWLGTENRYWKE